VGFREWLINIEALSSGGSSSETAVSVAAISARSLPTSTTHYQPPTAGISAKELANAESSDSVTDDAQASRGAAGSAESQVYSQPTIPDSPPPSLANVIKTNGTVIDKALATAVRVMLAIDLNVSNDQSDALGIRESLWEESKSLDAAIKELFPVDEKPEEWSGPIKQSKLRAQYLQAHANVKIEFTTNLADHLSLDTSDSPKTLQIFELASLLKLSYYQALSGTTTNLPLLESLKKYVSRCYLKINIGPC
jgi:hypothetical protein